MKMYYEPVNELYHHGIKGQRWGIRRYQNADGTLTSAGQKRYGPSGQQYLEAKSAKREANKEYRKAFDKAYNKSHQAYSFSKKKRQASEDRWNEAVDKADAARKADAAYKEAKQQMKNDRKEARMNESIKRGKQYVQAGRSKSNTVLRAVGMTGMNSFNTRMASGAMEAIGMKRTAQVIRTVGAINAWKIAADAAKQYNDINNYEKSKKS